MSRNSPFPSSRTACVAVPDQKENGDGYTPSLPEEKNISLVRIIGEPTTPNEAATLAEEDKYQIQWWALGLDGARPVEQKKGADHGVNGKILFTLFRRGHAAARSAGG